MSDETTPNAETAEPTAEIKTLKQALAVIADLRADVQRVHRDITGMEAEVSEVYTTITNSKFSKPNTAKEYILAEYEERLKEAAKEGAEASAARVAELEAQVAEVAVLRAELEAAREVAHLMRAEVGRVRRFAEENLPFEIDARRRSDESLAVYEQWEKGLAEAVEATEATEATEAGQ